MNPAVFSHLLLDWSYSNQRDLPWKKTNDPYKIWISEIILQQTRVKQGVSYYEKFIAAFPTIAILADATEDQVLKLWEGLGYYTRARNIHTSAKYIKNHLNGIFPNTYQNISTLKGVGPYTAAAIASFAFDLPHAVVDGNVYRIVTRLNGIYGDIQKKETNTIIQDFVSTAIQGVRPSSFNQALMDFGSIVCKPQNPSCEICPFQEYCVALDSNTIKILPNKAEKTSRKERYFYYFEITDQNDQTIICQRSNQDIWKGLYEWPNIELENHQLPNLEEILSVLDNICPGLEILDMNKSPIWESQQILTHRKIYGFFFRISVQNLHNKIKQPYYLVERKKVSNFAFPKIITEYIKYINQF